MKLNRIHFVKLLVKTPSWYIVKISIVQISERVNQPNSFVANCASRLYSPRSENLVCCDPIYSLWMPPNQASTLIIFFLTPVCLCQSNSNRPKETVVNRNSFKAIGIKCLENCLNHVNADYFHKGMQSYTSVGNYLKRQGGWLFQGVLWRVFWRSIVQRRGTIYH